MKLTKKDFKVAVRVPVSSGRARFISKIEEYFYHGVSSVNLSDLPFEGYERFSSIKFGDKAICCDYAWQEKNGVFELYQLKD